jgi:hypothetical protein
MTAGARTRATAYQDAADLARYPIHELASTAGQALVTACRRQMEAAGVCQLPGFLTGPAVETMVGQAGELAPAAWATDQTHTVYFEPADESVPARHPRAAQQRSAKKAIAYDRIPASSPIRRLYESDDLTAFIAAVLGKEVLYRSADPLDALEIATFDEGDELGWHFDRSEFSVTVMYQESDGGGHFDYYPHLRSGHNENYPAVQQVLDGDPEGVIRLPSSPGTLAFFRGQHALHRVTPVTGPRPRINSVLTYGERPDMKLNQLTQKLFYGRTA